MGGGLDDVQQEPGCHADRQRHQHPVDPQRVGAARAGQLSARQAEQLAGLLAILGDPVRARILTALLAAEELCVGDLGLALEVNQDAASYALRVLRRHGLVEQRAAGRLRFYRLTDGRTRPTLAAVLQQLQQLARGAGQPADPSAREPRT